jgi:hypothetical protein
MTAGRTARETDRGITTRWRRDGREVYYIAPNGTLMAVPLAIIGAAIEPGPPTVLFQTRIVNGGASRIGTTWQYAVNSDGRFVMNVVADDASTSSITVIQHWQANR